VKGLGATKFSKAYKVLKGIYKSCGTVDEIAKHGKDNYEKILPFMDLNQRKEFCPLIMTLIMFEATPNLNAKGGN